MSVTSQNDISYCLEVDAEVIEVILKVYHMVEYFCLLLSVFLHVNIITCTLMSIHLFLKNFLHTRDRSMPP